MRVIKSIFHCVVLVVALIGQHSGCKTATGPNPPPDDGGNSTEYGTGTMSFDLSNRDEVFFASGPYKPSDKFANDSASQGVGGFVRDTSLFGKRIQAVLVGYTHALM